MVSKNLQIEGMSCSACETRIENKLQKLDGVQSANASYAKGVLKVAFDEKRVSLDAITQVIEKMDYHVKGEFVTEKKPNEGMSLKLLAVIGVILLGVYLIVQNTIGLDIIPEVDASMGYGLLFIVGLLTSLHCIAMCGGINISQTVVKGDAPKTVKDKLFPSLLYNLGRVISYTVIGGIVGAIGSAFSLSGSGKAVVSFIAGGFMVIMGLNMLNVFPWLRRLQPRLPKSLGKLINNGKRGKGPLIVGLLNGLMPCGPLQTMQIYAFGTGSFLGGALSMLVFSLGTVPLMFGLGALSSFLTSKFTKNMMKISALLVLVLGVVMFGRGLALSGVDVTAMLGGDSSVAQIKDGIQEVTTVLQPNSYEAITVKVGVPVKWTIKAEEENINGCNNEFTIPDFNLTVPLLPGDNVVEFTPTSTGTVGYSCWMGMIQSNIKIVD